MNSHGLGDKMATHGRWVFGCGFILAVSCSSAFTQDLRETSQPRSKRRAKVQNSSLTTPARDVGDRELDETGKQSGQRVRTNATEPSIDDETYDLAALRSLAFDHNPSLFEVSAHIDSLIGKRTQAGLWPNPDVGFSGQQVASRGLAEQNGVLVGQRIITAKKLHTDQAIVSEEIRRAQYRYDAQKQRVETDVTVAFYECLAAQRLLDLADELVRIAEEGQRTVAALKQASEVSRIDVLQSSLELESSRIRSDNARHRLVAAWKNLASVVGVKNLPRRRLDGVLREGFVPYSWDDALTQLLEQSPELRVASATAERARWVHQRAMREVYPNIDVSGVVQKDHAISGWDGMIQASIPVPILNRNQGGIREALANIAVAEQAYERTRLQLENRLARVFEQYMNALRQTERYEKDLLPTAKEQLRLSQRVFESGETAYIMYLTAQRSFSQVNVGAVEAQRDLATSSSRIRGLLLEGSLEDQNLAP